MSDTKQIDDGGPAFPSDNFGQPAAQGMSLRDWFAGMALQGIVGAVTSAFLHNSAQTPDDDTIAKWAYEQADAMLAARKEVR